jgi:hypothetical protein
MDPIPDPAIFVIDHQDGNKKTEPTDAGIELGTVATAALTVRRSNH